MSQVSDYAIYAEYSPDSKKVENGWNRRVFTDVEAQSGDRVGLHKVTGVITLAPGTYHMTGFSAVTYATFEEPPQMVTTRCPAAGGYCRLRYLDPEIDVAGNGSPNDVPNEDAIVVGSGATANVIPSLFEAYLTKDEEARLILEHQSGNDPQQIYLRQFSEGSFWHVFARISIRRL